MQGTSIGDSKMEKHVKRLSRVAIVIGVVGFLLGAWVIGQWIRIQLKIMHARDLVLSENPREREKGLWELLRYGEQVPLERALKLSYDEDEFVRVAAILHLRQYGAKAVKRLLRELVKPESNILCGGSMLRTPQQVITMALVNPDKRVIEELIPHLGDAHPLIRSAVRDVLKRIGKPAIPYIVDVVMNSKDLNQRINAVSVLGQMKDMAVPVLKRVVENESIDLQVRIAAINALGVTQSRDAFEVLKRLFDNAKAAKHPTLKASVLIAIGAVNIPEAKRFLLELAKGEGPDADIASALGSARCKEAVDILVKWLDTSDEILASSVAFALGQIGDKRAVPYLIKVVENSKAGVIAGIIALGQLRDRRAIPVLRKALQSSNPHIRAQAIFAIRQFNDRAFIEDLKPLLNDPDKLVRERAKDAIKFLNQFGM